MMKRRVEVSEWRLSCCHMLSVQQSSVGPLISQLRGCTVVFDCLFVFCQLLLPAVHQIFYSFSFLLLFCLRLFVHNKKAFCLKVSTWWRLNFNFWKMFPFKLVEISFLRVDTCSVYSVEKTSGCFCLPASYRWTNTQMCEDAKICGASDYRKQNERRRLLAAF